jgi:hypothetical protein
LDWHQGGLNVKYEKQTLRYEFLSEMFLEEAITYSCLRFDFVFDTDWQTVQFSYCPPFTYSQMLVMVSGLKKEMADAVDNPSKCINGVIKITSGKRSWERAWEDSPSHCSPSPTPNRKTRPRE